VSRGNPSGEWEEAGREKLLPAIQAGREGNYPKAVLILEKLLAEGGAPPEGCLLLGRAFHALKDYSRALAAFNDYRKLRPHSPEGYLFAGRTCLALGMPHRAVPLLRKALDYNPEDPRTMALLGTAYLRSKHSQLAVSMLQGAVENAGEAARSGKKPELPSKERERIYRAYLNALLVRGICLCRNEDYVAAIPMLCFVLENGGGSPLLRLELGRAFRERGELEEALEHFSQALKLAPKDPGIRWYRASVLMSLGRNADALREIQIIRSASAENQENTIPDFIPSAETVDFFMIRSLLEKGEWRRTAEACRNWLKYRRNNALIHAVYAEALRNLKNYEAAQNHLERALELEPRQLELWYARIFTAWEMKDWKLLSRSLKAALALGGDPELINRFQLLWEAKNGGDDQRIITGLQNAIRSRGPEPDLMYALGEVYLKTGFTRAALSWFRKTKTLLQNHEAAYLGEIAALEALYEEAPVPAGKELKTAYAEYLDRWPNNHTIRREQASFLVRTGDYVAACRELETLLAWEPANPSLRRVLAYAYRKTGRYREAALFLKSLLKEKPRNLQLLLEYSGCLERSGAAVYAVTVLEKAQAFLRETPDIPLALGIIFFRQGKIERAFDFLRQAAAINPKDPRPYQWMAFISGKEGRGEAGKKYEAEANKRKGRA
jgi:tetratricopeptide (TPR) repeat protein